MSEGGFAPNRISAASILDIATTQDKKGRVFYQYEVLVRTGKAGCRTLGDSQLTFVPCIA